MIPRSCKCPEYSWCSHNFVYDGANKVLISSGNCFPGVSRKWQTMLYTDRRRMKPSECVVCKKCMLCFFIVFFKVFLYGLYVLIFVLWEMLQLCMQYITLHCAGQWNGLCVSSYSISCCIFVVLWIVVVLCQICYTEMLPASAVMLIFDAKDMMLKVREGFKNMK